LFAAKAGNPHEDIFMTCARILESASDVSLVREAAAYLEQMEKPFL
jgi:A1 cistron-splicing factor AAR2